MAGQPALSKFRLDKLTRTLQRQDDRVSKLEARYTYFVSLAEAPSRKQKQQLIALLFLFSGGCLDEADEIRKTRLKLTDPFILALQRTCQLVEAEFRERRLASHLQYFSGGRSQRGGIGQCENLISLGDTVETAMIPEQC